MFAIVALLSLLHARGAAASEASCAVLFCGVGDQCERRFGDEWLHAALDEATRSMSTVAGDFLAPACRSPTAATTYAPSSAAPWRATSTAVDTEHTMLCIDPSCLPTTCAYKKCNYTAHPELWADDAVNCDDKCQRRLAHKADELDKASCRTIASWQAIAWTKLSDALDAHDAASYNATASAGCVAQLLFSRINERIAELTTDAAVTNGALAFIDAHARSHHRHEFTHSTAKRVHSAVDQHATGTTVRGIQVQRVCAKDFDAAVAITPVTRLLVLTRTNATQVTDERVAQLTWAVAGSIVGFDKTVTRVDPTNECARDAVSTNLIEFDAARRQPGVAAQDWAVVYEGGSVTPRPYLDLQPASTCPLVVLAQDVSSTVTVGASVTALNLRRGTPRVTADELDTSLERSLFWRTAHTDACTDVGVELRSTTAPEEEEEASVSEPAARRFGTASSTKAVLFSAPKDTPITLAPGTSVCVGGVRSGASCSQASECGREWACRRKPFAPHHAAYCYDGDNWDETRACAFADADDQCPFGECVGQANGLEGGLYPLKYFYDAHNCQAPGSATGEAAAICGDEHVINWRAYPNAALATK